MVFWHNYAVAVFYLLQVRVGGILSDHRQIVILFGQVLDGVLLFLIFKIPFVFGLILVGIVMVPVVVKKFFADTCGAIKFDWAFAVEFLSNIL